MLLFYKIFNLYSSVNEELQLFTTVLQWLGELFHVVFLEYSTASWSQNSLRWAAVYFKRPREITLSTTVTVYFWACSNIAGSLIDIYFLILLVINWVTYKVILLAYWFTRIGFCCTTYIFRLHVIFYFNNSNKIIKYVWKALLI